MVDKFISYLCEPLNAKLMLEVSERKQVTTAQLAEKFNEIPQATLYRRLQKMLGDGVLKVVEERQIRGTVEKVYALGFDIQENKQNLIESNDSQAYMQWVTHYMFGILQEFKEYTEKEDINIGGDGSGFSIAPIYATYQELEDTFNEIGAIVKKLKENQPSGERKLHNFCVIATPPKN
jgi:DNA-binding PadR family transcriptional regulator